MFINSFIKKITYICINNVHNKMNLREKVIFELFSKESRLHLTVSLLLCSPCWLSNNRQVPSGKKAEATRAFPTPPLRCSSQGQSLNSQRSSGPLVSAPVSASPLHMLLYCWSLLGAEAGSGCDCDLCTVHMGPLLVVSRTSGSGDSLRVHLWP